MMPRRFGIVLALVVVVAGCMGPTEPLQAAGAPSTPISPLAASTALPVVLHYETPTDLRYSVEKWFEVPNGTNGLSFTVFLNASAAGPYLVEPFRCLCDPHLALRSPYDGSFRPTWSQSFSFFPVVTAGAAAGSEVIQGPFEGSIDAPAEGTWTLRLLGTGRNVQADFTATFS